MKKMIIILAILGLSMGLSAQQIPNGSFTYWSGALAPYYWSTWATIIANYNGVLADSVQKLAARDSIADDISTDSSALMLSVDTTSFPGQGVVTLPGFASLGDAGYVTNSSGVTGLQFGYLLYDSRPQTFYCDYKFISAAGYTDTAAVVIAITRYDTIYQVRDTFLAATLLFPPSSSWVHGMSFNLLPYYNSNTTGIPDSMQLIIFSSIGANPHQGTRLWIDTVHFDASVEFVDTFPLGISETKNIPGVKAYPNPACQELNILVQQSEIGSTMELYDATGRLVYKAVIDKALYTVDINTFTEGVYEIIVRSRGFSTNYRGKVTIAK